MYAKVNWYIFWGTVHNGLLYQGILYCTYIGAAKFHIFFVSGMIIDRTQIQQEVYSESWCFAHSMLSCLSSWNLCKMYGRPMQEFFSGLLYAHEFFFHLIFPCMNFFFVLRPPTITFLMVRPLRRVAQARANNTTARKINICISARRKTWKWDKTEKLFSKR